MSYISCCIGIIIKNIVGIAKSYCKVKLYIIKIFSFVCYNLPWSFLKHLKSYQFYSPAHYFRKRANLLLSSFKTIPFQVRSTSKFTCAEFAQKIRGSKTRCVQGIKSYPNSSHKNACAIFRFCAIVLNVCIKIFQFAHFMLITRDLCSLAMSQFA